MHSRRRGTGITHLLAVLLLVVVVGFEWTGHAAPLPAAQQTDEQLILKGREAIGQACQACHRNIARMLQIERRSPEQWRDTVYSMISRGAHIFPDEIEPLVAHLTASYGPSNVSTPPSADSGQPIALPAGAGRAILERACLQCHDLETATRKPVLLDWKTVVGTMATYGAMMTPAEQETLIEYLGGLAPPP